MDAPVAAAEKCAQYPGYESDDDRAPESAAKIIDMKARHDVRDKP